MTSSTASAAISAVEAIRPFDPLEAAHRTDTLSWLASGVEVCRSATIDVPDPHLVVYFVLVDAAGRVLLVDHRRAGLWLPPGGHVETGEDPRCTVRREAQEELGVAPDLLDGLPSNPLFVTCTPTVGHRDVHLDVSLWYVLDAADLPPLVPDPGELRDVRWWTPVAATGLGDRADPHLGRFVAKLVGASG